MNEKVDSWKFWLVYNVVTYFRFPCVLDRINQDLRQGKQTRVSKDCPDWDSQRSTSGESHQCVESAVYIHWAFTFLFWSTIDVEYLINWYTWRFRLITGFVWWYWSYHISYWWYITSIKSFDLSTLYSTIPHDKLKSRLASIIRNSFMFKNGNRRYKYLVLGHEESYFVKEHSDSNTSTLKMTSSRCLIFW